MRPRGARLGWVAGGVIEALNDAKRAWTKCWQVDRTGSMVQADVCSATLNKQDHAKHEAAPSGKSQSGWSARSAMELHRPDSIR
jgi:hypothetical protein